DAPTTAPALGYEYVISTTNTPPTAAGTAVTTTFAQVTTGLVPTTQYYVFVRAVCSATDASPWLGPITFTTACAPITTLPHVEPFATFLPSVCWIKGDNGNLTTGPATFGTNSWFEDGLGNNGTTGAVKYNLYLASANDWIISPQFSIPATGWELKFDAAAANYGVTTAVTNWEADDFVEVLVSSSASGLTNWTTLYTYNNANVPAPAGVPNIIDLDAYAGQTVRFAYRAVEGTADGSADIDFSFDNFEIRLSPACPQPTNVVVSNVTATGAGSSWDVMAGAASGYEYVVSTSATPPTGAGTAVTTAFVALTGLTPQTPYYLYVRANCGSGSFSVWSVQTFTTQCAPVTALPWTEGFEGLTTFSSTDFPSCWYKQNGDWASRNTNDTYSTANTGTNFIRNSYNATNEFMWTPGFQLTAGTSYDFSSFIQGDNATTWVVDYFVNSNQNSTGATQLGASYNIPGTGTPYSAQPYTKITRSFVPTTSGVYYF
ncbi:MAG: fibronectin type III domain-containing protein, partial [Dolichospermum sp.]